MLQALTRPKLGAETGAARAARPLPFRSPARRVARSVARGCCLLAGSWLALCSVASGAGIDFQKEVLPVLQQHCIDCHGPDGAEGNLRLDSPQEALRGGDSGEPAIVPGKADASYLIARILQKDPADRMPLGAAPLKPREIETLKRWVNDAAAWADVQKASGRDRPDHWSFQPVARPPLPLAGKHPVDAFITAKLHDAGMSPSPAASRRILVRRLYLVMHGLPPTPPQVEQFLSDSADGAWQRLVERVLNSPRFGEHWATHWLDLVHFGETHGFETNRERPHAWRYRDWVIDAFNQDKPYDQFLLEQLAGDVLGSEVATGFLVAGPYDLVKGQDPQLRLMQRQDELADIINTTGTAFLGLTLGCARCHNHKFDPVTQTDYYALQAVFAGVNHGDRALPLSEEARLRIAAIDEQIVDLESGLAKFIPSADEARSDKRPPVNARENIERFPPVEARFVRFTINATNQSQPCIDELEVFAGEKNVALASGGAKASSSGDFVHPLHKLEHINDGRYGNARSWIAGQVTGGWVQIELPELAKIDRIVWGRDREGQYSDRLAVDYRIEASRDGETWKPLASSADRRPFKTGQPTMPVYDFAAFGVEEAARGREMLEQLEGLRKKRDELDQPALAYAGTFRQPGPTHRLYRGEPTAPREMVAPAAIESLTSLRLPADAPEQQRRMAVARWIADDQNPLTARVIVNRLWQFHFGTGIVDTPSDFGANGTPPSHPELLDWLAAELVAHNWSLKHIHRLILTSETWRQDSRPRQEAMAADAGTRLLWRFPPRRLQAESIRDSILSVAGTLDLRMGGPGFSAFEVEAENVRHYHPKQNYGPGDWRRMVYMTKVRQERDAVFGVFDCPDYSQVVPQRSRSTTPLQALNLLNSRFVMQQAEQFAGRLEREADSPAGRIKLAYELCFGRPPDAEETEQAIAFVQESDWRQFARAMLNANEFVFIP